MKLTSLKRTAADKKAESERYKTIGPSNGEDYGYGLSICLDKSALAKLGLKPSDFDVGDEVKFAGRGVIKALRQDKSNSYDSASVEIQIQKIGVEGGSVTDAVDAALDSLEDDE